MYLDMKVEYIGSYGLFDQQGEPVHLDFDGTKRKYPMDCVFQIQVFV